MTERIESSRQQDVAEATGLSQTMISRYYNGRTPIENMPLGTFLKLYPDAEISLHKKSSESIKQNLLTIVDAMKPSDIKKLYEISRILLDNKEVFDEI